MSGSRFASPVVTSPTALSQSYQEASMINLMQSTQPVLNRGQSVFTRNHRPVLTDEDRQRARMMKRGNSLMAKHPGARNSMSDLGFLPQLGSAGSSHKSRVDIAVQQRSTQLLDKMAQRLSLTSEKNEGETESSRPKFRKSVVELTEDCEYRRDLEKHAQRRNTQGSSGVESQWWRRASAASNSVVSSQKDKIDQDKEKLR